MPISQMLWFRYRICYGSKTTLNPVFKSFILECARFPSTGNGTKCSPDILKPDPTVTVFIYLPGKEPQCFMYRMYAQYDHFYRKLYFQPTLPLLLQKQDYFWFFFIFTNTKICKLKICYFLQEKHLWKKKNP